MLYTIGHSNHPIEKFLGLVQSYGITQLVDVRSRPYSRFNPQFNKKALQQSLLEHQVEYIYLGESLGGKPSDPSCYIHGALPEKSSDYLSEVDYPAVMQKPWFVDGIRHLLKMSGQSTTCILCSEKDPANCHRQHLIARYLLVNHPEVTIQHILADRSLLNAASFASQGDQQEPGKLALDL